MSMNPEDFADVVLSLSPDRVTPARIEVSARRILNFKAALGLWDFPNGFESRLYVTLRRFQNCLTRIGRDFFGTSRTRLLASSAIEDSVVLLKNRDNLLPIPVNDNNLRLLVSGPAADSVRALSGAWTFKWQGADDDSLIKHKGRTILQGIRARLSPLGVSVQYSAGCFSFDDCGGTAAAVEVAKGVDYAILVLGERPYAEGAYNVGDLELQGSQLELVRSVARVCKKVIVIFVQGRPRTFRPVENDISGILYAFLPGPEAGNAIARILVGDVSPSGRLPFGYPTASNQIGLPLSRYNASVQWPFGFGLSYSTFRYSNLTVSPAAIANLTQDTRLNVSVMITNEGPVEAKETALLFIDEPILAGGTVLEWPFVLKRFKKLSLAPEASALVSFILRGSDWRYHLNSSKLAAVSAIQVRVGWQGSDNARLKRIPVSVEQQPRQVPFQAPDIPADEANVIFLGKIPPVTPVAPPVQPPLSPEPSPLPSPSHIAPLAIFAPLTAPTSLDTPAQRTPTPPPALLPITPPISSAAVKQNALGLLGSLVFVLCQYTWQFD